MVTKKSPIDWNRRQDTAAPQEVLMMISCKCRGSYNAACSCRKAYCSVMCGPCQGRGCSHFETNIEDQGDDEKID